MPPFTEATFAFIRTLAGRMAQGEHLALHCRLGIGRSGMMAASVLVQSGMSPGDAFTHLTRVRGLMVPDTPAQLAWVEAFARLLSP